MSATETPFETVPDESEEQTSSLGRDLGKIFLQNAAAAAGLWGGMTVVAYGAKKLLDRREAKEAETAPQTETPTTES